MRALGELLHRQSQCCMTTLADATRSPSQAPVKVRYMTEAFVRVMELGPVQRILIVSKTLPRPLTHTEDPSHQREKTSAKATAATEEAPGRTEKTKKLLVHRRAVRAEHRARRGGRGHGLSTQRKSTAQCVTLATRQEQPR
jgi:hypothetical protein